MTKKTGDNSFLAEEGVSHINVPYALFKLKATHGFSHSESYLALFLFTVSHFKNSFQFSKSYSEIAKDSGLSKRKVIDCIARMIEVGILKAELNNNRQNVYHWNKGFLIFSGANGSPREVKNIHLEGENGSPFEVKTVHHIYIAFFKEVFKETHREFFSEAGAGYFFRVPPKKKSAKDKKDGKDLPSSPKKKFVSRSEAWDLAIESVLKELRDTELFSVHFFLSLS